MRSFLAVAAAVVLIAAGVFIGSRLTAAPPSPTVVERLRAVSRLQVLDVTVTRKVSLQPDPSPRATLTGSLVQWAKYAVDPPSGTALVSAEAHYAVDLSRLTAADVVVTGKRVEMTLPEAEVAIELTPSQTEVLVSNLDSAQTTALLEKAQAEFAHAMQNDARLKAKARASAEKTLSGLILALGFEEVRFNQPEPKLGLSR